MARCRSKTCWHYLSSSLSTAARSRSLPTQGASLSRLSAWRETYSGCDCRLSISACRWARCALTSLARWVALAYSWGSRGQLRNWGLNSSTNINKIYIIDYRTMHPRAKLSVSTVYPVGLPKLKFYTERAIHEELPPDPRSPVRQTPITFVRYMRNKYKRRFASQTEPALPLSTMHESIMITNCLDREERHGLEEGGQREGGALGRGDSAGGLAQLAAKMGKAIKEREERSGIVLNYYKRKFLKFRCRKSIELDSLHPDATNQPQKRAAQLLADGLKIEKIQTVESPKAPRELVFNKAKFNTIAEIPPVSVRRSKRWEIGPWLSQADSYF